MTATEKNARIREDALSVLREALASVDAIQVADYKFAIPVTVDGEERYCEMSLVAKNNKATANSDAYDPLFLSDDWYMQKEQKAKIKEEKAKAKAAKTAEAEAKRAARLAAKEAKREDVKALKRPLTNEEREKWNKEKNTKAAKSAETA